MDNATVNVIDTLHDLSLQLLVRLAADLTALEALASAEEPVPDRKASAALFHHSARKGCCQLHHYLTALHSLTHERGSEEKTWPPHVDRNIFPNNCYD